MAEIAKIRLNILADGFMDIDSRKSRKRARFNRAAVGQVPVDKF